MANSAHMILQILPRGLPRQIADVNLETSAVKRSGITNEISLSYKYAQPGRGNAVLSECGTLNLPTSAILRIILARKSKSGIDQLKEPSPRKLQYYRMNAQLVAKRISIRDALALP